MTKGRTLTVAEAESKQPSLADGLFALRVQVGLLKKQIADLDDGFFSRMPADEARGMRHSYVKMKTEATALERLYELLVPLIPMENTLREMAGK